MNYNVILASSCVLSICFILLSSYYLNMADRSYYNIKRSYNKRANITLAFACIYFTITTYLVVVML